MIKNKYPLPSWSKNIPREQYNNFKEIQTDSDWFKVYELPNDIIAIYEPYHIQESISYLIKGSSACLLWDTGLGMFDIKSVVDSLIDKPLAVVNSHYHFDHIGGNRYFPQVHVFNQKVMTDRLKKGVTAIDVEQGFMKESINYQGKISFDIESYSIPPTNNFTTIEDGHVFDLGNRKFMAIHTPIHSPESIILVSDDEKIVFTGDTIHPINTCVHLGFSPLNAEIIHSMDKFAEKYVNYQLFCSHIEPMQEGNRLLDIAKAFHQIKEDDLAYQIDNDGFKRYGFDGFSVTVE